MMKIRTVVMVAALSLAALAMPAATEAGHHHSRWCGHGGHCSRYDRGYRSYGHGYAHGHYGYYGGPYLYPHVYAPAYAHAPYPGYYAPRYCRRPRVSVFLGFGF